MINRGLTMPALTLPAVGVRGEASHTATRPTAARTAYLLAVVRPASPEQPAAIVNPERAAISAPHFCVGGFRTECF